MVRPIMRDIFFLRQKAQPATKEDKQIVQAPSGYTESQRSRMRGDGCQYDWSK